MDVSEFSRNKLNDRATWEGFRTVRRVNFRDKTIESSFCAGTNYERYVTVPTLPELSESSIKGCKFCSKLKEMLSDQYCECSWWTDTASSVRMSMQYEWKQRSSMVKKGEPIQALNCLAVVVHHSDVRNKEVDVYDFDIRAWPGKLR